MKWIWFFCSFVFTIVLILLLHFRWSPSLPPLGKLLSPQHGCWQNAEAIDQDFNASIHLPQLKGKATVWLDERLVPHIFAEEESDAYLVQGYLHARFRLWQMEVQTMAAAGRLSEIMGRSMLEKDRMMRRMGMVYAAENALKLMEANPLTKSALDAYTAGVNAYIRTLNNRTLPLEYKLLDYKPEPWTNLKSALLLKYMSYDLTGRVNDLEYTNARKIFSASDFEQMYPLFADSLDPIVPAGTRFGKPSLHPQMPDDSILLVDEQLLNDHPDQPHPANGSNNWAVSGSKTASGAPIICNDPHLSLNLPSLWFEVQLHTPEMNVYGVSLPGAPGVVIGFNDFIGWGVTNAQRDVKDFYRIQFEKGNKRRYWYNGRYEEAELKLETYKVRGDQPFYDTVAYTVFGPVMFDSSFPVSADKSTCLAIRWQAHDPSNELLTFRLLNHAKNYTDYLLALQHYVCPAQNFAFAAKTGEIACWQQGKFPAKWKGQGLFVMPGKDSTYQWQGYIPQAENPHLYNPKRGFVSSANQNPTDDSYPYFYNGNFILYRGLTINRKLNAMNNIRPQDMMRLQTDYYNAFAAEAIPFLLRHLQENNLPEVAQKYVQLIAGWDFNQTPYSKASTVFSLWWNQLQSNIWDDELKRKDSIKLLYPEKYATLEWLLRDSSMHFVDNVNTPQKESLSQQVTVAFARILPELQELDKKDRLELGRYRGTNIQHLTRLPAFGRMRLFTGGDGNTINAITQDHGPSWRMVVQLSSPIEAYGIYPGGQNGNPGSRFYDNMIDDWVAGKYYTLHFFNQKDNRNPFIKFKMQFSKN